MLKLSWAQAAAWRARRHHLDARAPAGSMLAVASRICGLHAQVMSSAELSLWTRVDNLAREAVRGALWDDRTLVKTWAMRGTLHLLCAGEWPVWRAALSENPDPFGRPALWRRFGLTMLQVEALTESIGAALDGRVLTREELADEVGRRVGSRQLGSRLAENSWGALLRPAAFTGRLCFAPGVGARVRFTRPDTWLARAAAPAADPVQAAGIVTRSFLGAYGPAAYSDLAHWWSASLATARRWIGSLGEEVCPVDLEGTRTWMLAVHVEEARGLEPARSVRLLPAFDPYVVAASKHAAHLLPGDFRGRVYRPQGWISPVLLVNGTMQGVWRHEIKGSRIEVTVEPFGKAPAWVRRAAAGEAEKLADFLGGTLHLAWS